MAAIVQVSVVDRRRAGNVAGRVQLALEGLRADAGERKGGRGAVGQRVGVGGNGGVGRGGVDCPGIAGRAAHVAGGVRGPRLEGVAGFAEAGIALGRRTGGVAAAVELTLERARFAAGELECGIGAGGGGRRFGGDRCLRRGQVHRPAPRGRRRVNVAQRVLGLDAEGVIAVEQVEVSDAVAAARNPGVGIRLAIEIDAGGVVALAAGEGEVGRRVVGEGRRFGGDGRLGRCGVQRPGVDGRCGVEVAGGITGAYREGVAAVAQAVVGLGRRAGAVVGAIELAGERGPGLGAAEGECGAAAGRRVGRIGINRRVRHDGINGPGVGGRAGVNVAGGVLGPHAEGVAAVGQIAIALGRGAGGEVAAIELTLEHRPSLAAAEGECGAVAARWVVRLARQRRVRHNGVNGPGMAGRGRVGERGAVDGPDLERMAAIGQIIVALGRRTGGKPAAVELTLEGVARVAAAEGERGCRAGCHGCRFAAGDRCRRADLVDYPIIQGGIFVGFGVTEGVGGHHFEDPTAVVEAGEGHGAGARLHNRLDVAGWYIAPEPDEAAEGGRLVGREVEGSVGAV